MDIEIELEKIISRQKIKLCDLEFEEDDDEGNDPYFKISKCLEIYEIEQSDEILKRLIFEYIEIRDFKNTFKYIDEYIKHGFSDSNIFVALKEELNCFFDNIHKALSYVEKKQILMCWIDSVQYDEVEEFPFLKKMRDDSLCFDNAYTVMPYTVATFWTLFCQKMPIEDGYHKYRYEHITKDNSVVLKTLDEHGLNFVYHGSSMELFGIEKPNYKLRKYTECSIGDGENKVKEIMQQSTTNPSEDICTRVLWNGLKTLLQGKEVFSLLYMVLETHTPYIAGNIKSGYVNNQFKPKIEQIASAREYIDGQLEFYWNIWKDYATTIFMSDHGKVVKGTKKRYYRDRFHTMMMINGKDIVNKHVTEMFSYIDFVDIVKYCICPYENIEIKTRKYVPVENLDAYGKVAIMGMLSGKNIAKNSLVGYRGIRTENEMFLQRNDGQKIYYKYPCIQNLYGVEDSSRIERVCNDYFKLPLIDIWNNNFFKHTQKIYRAIERHDNRMAEKQREADLLLKKLILLFDEGAVVALRGGGESANEIIKKTKGLINIKYIIDQALTTDEGWPGCEYIQSSQINEKKITDIIITSYDNRYIMRDELKCYENDIRIIDLYEFFEKNGLLLGEDYHADKICPEDLKEFIND